VPGQLVGKFGRMGQRGQMTARDGLGSYPEPVPRLCRAKTSMSR
jgi:hypothetical protein